MRLYIEIEDMFSVINSFYHVSGESLAMPHDFTRYVSLEKLGKISNGYIIAALLVTAYSLALFQ